MVTRTKYKSLENPTGVGEVWKGNQKIATVTYNLDVQQEILIVETSTGTSEVEGLKSMSGSISMHEKAKALWGRDKLTLHMQDGRKVDFFVTSGSAGSGNIEIQPSGGFY